MGLRNTSRLGLMGLRNIYMLELIGLRNVFAEVARELRAGATITYVTVTSCACASQFPIDGLTD